MSSPMPRCRRRLSVSLVLFIVLFAVGLAGAVALGLGWVLQWVLVSFGVDAPYWPCVVAIVLFEAIAGGRGERS